MLAGSLGQQRSWNVEMVGGGICWAAPKRISTEFHKQFKDSLAQNYDEIKVPADADVATSGIWSD
eukprot:3995201-Pyramimonas_sp.AAC.1